MQQGQVDELGFCPSFNCYYSDTLTSAAANRVSTQLQQERATRFHDIEEEDFEFSLVPGREDFPAKGITSDVFPLFNSDPPIKVEVNREIDHGEDACSSSLEKLFINEREESPSTSSSEADESESEDEPPGPGVFCVWRHTGSSPLSKCKKSSSTGSGSKRWRIRDLLRRSNSEGKEPTVLLTHTTPKQQRNSEQVFKVAGKVKPSVHELLYLKQREGGKRKSYLPYRQGLVGFFNNVNGKGKKLA